MARPKRQIKDQAASLLREGKYQKALELFQQVAAEDPNDYSARRNVGYLLRKLGRSDEAVEVFVKLANEYAADGFMLKAIATCKVVLEIDPHHTKTQERLADLYSSRTSTKTPDIKVMADVSASGAVSAGAISGPGLSSDAIELPAGGGEEGFEIQRTTPPDHYGMVQLPAGDAAAGESGSAPEPTYIEMIELEPIPLEPVEVKPAPSEPAGDAAAEAAVQGQLIAPPPGLAPDAPVVGTLVAPAESPAPPDLEPVPADELNIEGTPEPAPQPDTDNDPTTETAPGGDPTQDLSSEAASGAKEGVALPDIEIDIEFDVEEAPPKQEANAPEIPLFCDLEPDAFISLLEQMKMIRMKPGQWILKEGEAGSSMFTIASGKVRVLKRVGARKLLQLAQLGEGTFFGEMSLLRGGLRGASVQATESGELFEMSRELMDSVAKRYPAVEEVLQKFSHQRLLRNVMATSSLFSPFSKQERIEIIQCFVSREVEPGEVLITEGAETDGLYVVLRGKMEVTCKTGDDELLPVGELGEGEVFGEISCLRKDPAIATVKAKVPGSVLRLPRADFDALVMSHPQILELVSKLSDERIAETSNLLAKKGILI